MPLQKSTIVLTALEMLNRDGLENLTLRRLAAELGVKAASLYWHVENKRALLDEMADGMLEPMLSQAPPADLAKPWAEWLAEMMAGLRLALLAYRDGAQVVVGINPNRARAFARLSAVIVSGLYEVYGLSLPLAGNLCSTLLIYTCGAVIEEQTSPPLEWILAKGPAVMQHLSGATAVAMVELMNQLRTSPPDHQALFAHGMELILAGAQSQLETLSQI